MKAKTLAEHKSTLCKWENRERNHLVLVATIIATLVLGYTPDLNGLVSWLGTFRPWKSSADETPALEIPEQSADGYAHPLPALQVDSRA